MRNKLTRSWWRSSHSEPNCREVGRVLQSFLDRELSEDDEDAVAAHLEVCRRCGMSADAYIEIKGALSSLGDDVDEDAVDRLRAFGEQLANGDA